MTKEVSRSTGFHSNIGKTFAGLAPSVLKVLKRAIAKKIYQENLCISLKAAKLFSRLTFVCYGI